MRSLLIVPAINARRAPQLRFSRPMLSRYVRISFGVAKLRRTVAFFCRPQTFDDTQCRDARTFASDVMRFRLEH
jgi:hypothetical protein